jgi:sarcosine oxidase
VTRETVAYFDLSRTEAPPSLLDWGGTADYPGVQVYGLLAGEGSLKAALHQAGPKADPDEVGEPDVAAVASVAGWAAETFALASPKPLRAETCLYTSTTDERFILERHGRIVVGSACSGHAFKFAPAIGVRLAELAAEALTS